MSKCYPFTKEGLELAINESLKDRAKQRMLDQLNDKEKMMYIAQIGLTIALMSSPLSVHAKDLDSGAMQLVRVAQKGLKYLSMYSVFYGLYLKLLKHDDNGKKVAVGAIVVYVCGLIVPSVYDYIDGMFK